MKYKASVIINKPWQHIIASAVLFALTYAAISWSIDSGKLQAYFISFVLLVFAVKHLIRAISGYARKG